mgnify:CR=1 FL=1
MNDSFSVYARHKKLLDFLMEGKKCKNIEFEDFSSEVSLCSRMCVC